MRFEVNRSCPGSSPELGPDGAPTGRLVRGASTLASLLRLVAEYQSAHMLPPAEAGRAYRLELVGVGEGDVPPFSTRFDAFGPVPGVGLERFQQGDGAGRHMSELRVVDVPDLDALIRIVDACGSIELQHQPTGRHPFRLTAEPR